VDELPRDIRPVGVRGVDEIDAKLRQVFECPDRLGPVEGRTLDSEAGDAHRPEAKAVDLDVATNLE
jgi:hypothetical protein